MKKNGKKIKVLICGLLACVSVFALSGCNAVKKTFYKMTTESSELGEQMGKETAEALLENGRSKDWILKIDDFFYNLLVKVIG